MIEKESANVICGIIIGSTIGIGVWAIITTVIYYILR